jgi:hypothetical protein
MRTRTLPGPGVTMAVMTLATIATVVVILTRWRGSGATPAHAADSNGAHEFERPESRPEEAEMAAAYEG